MERDEQDLRFMCLFSPCDLSDYQDVLLCSTFDLNKVIQAQTEGGCLSHHPTPRGGAIELGVQIRIRSLPCLPQ